MLSTRSIITKPAKPLPEQTRHVFHMIHTTYSSLDALDDREKTEFFESDLQTIFVSHEKNSQLRFTPKSNWRLQADFTPPTPKTPLPLITRQKFFFYFFFFFFTLILAWLNLAGRERKSQTELTVSVLKKKKDPKHTRD